MMIDRLADGDERRQGVADDRQPQKAKPRLRKTRQLERQRRHFVPGHQPGEGAGHQDRHGERAVLAVAPPHRLRHAPPASGRSAASQCSRLAADVSAYCVGRAGEVKRGPAEHRRRDVAEALDRIAPAAVGVLMRRQPGEAAGDQRVMTAVARWLFCTRARALDGDGGGQGGRGQFADPVAFGRAFREQGGERGLIGCFESGSSRDWEMGQYFIPFFFFFFFFFSIEVSGVDEFTVRF